VPEDDEDGNLERRSAQHRGGGGGGASGGGGGGKSFKVSLMQLHTCNISSELQSASISAAFDSCRSASGAA
jgi:hypothetical protein